MSGIDNYFTVIGDREEIENYLEKETEKAIITKNHKPIASLSTTNNEREFTKVENYTRDFQVYSSNPLLPKVKDGIIDVKDLVKVQYDADKFITFDKLKPSAVPLSATIVTLTDKTIANTLTSIFIPKRVSTCDFIYSEVGDVVLESELQFPNCKRLILQNDAPISSGFRFSRQYFTYKFPALEYFQYEGRCYSDNVNKIISPCYIENDALIDNSKYTDSNYEIEPVNETCVFCNECFGFNKTIKTVIILSNDFNAIPYEMFAQSSIEKFVTNSPIRHINSLAFHVADQLYACEFPVENLEYIGQLAFNAVQIASFDFSNAHKLRMIKSTAFAGNLALLEFKFPPSLQKIGESLFIGCENLRSIQEATNPVMEQQFDNIKTITRPFKYLDIHESSYTTIKYDWYETDRPIDKLIEYYNSQGIYGNNLEAVISNEFYQLTHYFNDNHRLPKLHQYYECFNFNPMNTTSNSRDKFVTASHFTYFENKGAFNGNAYEKSLYVYPLSHCIATFAGSCVTNVTIMLPTDPSAAQKLTLRYAFKDCYNLYKLTFLAENSSNFYPFCATVIDFFMMFAFDIKQVIQIYTNHPYTYHKLDSCTGSDRTAEDERQWENIYYYFGQRYENNFYINLSD